MGHALLRQNDAQVFKKHSQMKLQMKHEALTKANHMTGEAASSRGFDTVECRMTEFDTFEGVWGRTGCFRRELVF
jgi:hypothetical protein